MSSHHTLPPIDIAALHDAGRQFVLAVTGGGASAIGQLLSVPGGSRSLLAAFVPYSSAALIEFLSARPEQFCAETTARAMAIAAFERARKLVAAEVAAETAANLLVGLGCTASLASDRPKRGAHRAHLAWQSATCTASLSVELVKDARPREQEEQLVADLILCLAAEAADVPVDWTRVPLLQDRETLARRTMQAPDAWRALLLGQTRALCALGAEQGRGAPRLIFPGAFNPRHEGHRHMAALAEQMTGLPVEHEISIANVDKPPLDYLEMQRRLEHFATGDTLWFTRAPRFIDKVELFPGATFMVGADTVARFADPRYYAGDIAQRDRAIQRLNQQNCRFLVFGRLMGDRFRQLADLQLPAELLPLCQGVPVEQFREDVSSTEIRRQQGSEDE